MKKKLTIIGGGITGCALALYASKKNYEVKIYEKNGFLGGILRDALIDNHLFFQNCQYLNSNNKWHQKLFGKNFYFETFYHKKYSLSNLEGKEKLYEDIAGLATMRDIKFAKSSFYSKKIILLKDRLKLYPGSISSQIFKWLKKFKFDINDLSFLSCDGLGLRRIFPQKNLNILKKLKQKHKNFDDLFGLPNNLLYSKKIFAALPKRGFNYFFNQITKKLEEAGVKIFLNAVVKPEWQKKLLKIKHKNNFIKSDFFFWTGNPTGLIKSYGLPLLDSRHINGKNFFFNLLGKINNNFYIQIYDVNIPITRLFIYKLKNMLRLTVETNSKELKNKDIIKYCNKLFNRYFKNEGLKINENLNFTKENKKYVLITKKDLEIIKKFNNETKNSNLITGSWLKYSRDEKIDFAIKNFEKK